MPAKGFAKHWGKLKCDEPPMLFERHQLVVTPSGRKARLSQYWNNPTHEYCGAGAIRYEDTGETTVLALSLLRAWQPGVVYAAPPLRALELRPALPMTTPSCPSVSPPGSSATACFPADRCRRASTA